MTVRQAVVHMTPPTGRRAVQAAATRAEILGAARRLFSERGFARTNIRDVAAEAGVSPQTDYDSVGSKRALVAGLNDLIETEVQIGAIVGQCGDIVRTLVAGPPRSQTSPPYSLEGLRRHRAGVTRVAARLDELDALAQGLDPAAAGEARRRSPMRSTRCSSSTTTDGRSTGSRPGWPTPLAA
jgi:AcrR family transcriptional regulator